MNRILRIFSLMAFICALSTSTIVSTPTLAADPPYQSQMQQLLNSLGSLYYLQPLCGENENDWREHAAELIALDDPDEDRAQRLNGAFNQGYNAYARLHRTCMVSTREAISRLLNDADRLTRDIRSRYGE